MNAVERKNCYNYVGMAISRSNKQTLAVFVICAAVVGIAAWYAKSGYGVARTPPRGLETVAETPYDYQISSDGENADWRKQFLSDSTSMVRFADNSPKNSASPIEPLTVTDQLGINLFTQFWAAKEAGLEKDPQIVGNMADNFVSGIGGLISNPVYTMSDIKISDDVSQSALENYAVATISVLGKMPKQDAATIAKNAFDDGDMAILAEIDAIVLSYDKIANGLKSVSVPAPLARYHLDLINGATTVAENAKAIRTVNKDPAKGIAAISDYATGYEKISSAVSGIDAYYSSVGILLQARNE